MLKLLAKMLGSKIGQILIDIAVSAAGNALSDLLNITKSSMQVSEDIGNYIKLNLDVVPKEEIVQNISVIYKYEITNEQFEYFKSSLKGLGKFSISYDIIKKYLKEHEKDYEDYIINFAIEMVFLKYFK